MRVAWRLALYFTLAAPSLFADQWVKTFPIAGPPELRLKTQDATVVINAEDRHDIEARVTTAGFKISGNGVRIHDQVAGNVLELEVITPEIELSFGRHSVRVELKVPRELNCELKAGPGSVTVTGVKGKIVLTSKAGTIEGLDLDGKFEATTGQGKIRARGRFDALTLRSDLGAIDVEATPGSRMFSEWRISTEDGNLTLHLPPDFNADVDAQADEGHISIDLPYTVTGAPDPGKIRGKMNAGGEALILRTSGGSIKVLKK